MLGLFAGRDDVADLLAQVLDLGLEVGEHLLQAGNDEPRVMAVSWAAWSWFLVLVSSLLRAAMWRAPARDGQGRRIGALPRLEGQALDELGQERGIHCIGLGAGLHGLMRSVWRPWS